MAIDIAVAIIVLVFALWGWWRGMLRKLAAIGALVIASLLAGLVGRKAAHLAAERWDIHVGMLTVLYVVCGVVAWGVLFILGRILLGFVAKRLGSNKEGTPAGWNRGLGALFGGIEALVLCWFIVAIFDVIPEDIRARRFPPLHEAMQASPVVVPLTHATSPAAHLELQPLISDLAVIADQPSVLRSLEEEEAVRELAKNEKMRKVLDDKELMAEWRKGRVTWVLSHPRVAEALEDPDIRDTLRRTDLRDALRRLAAQAKDDGD